ncbi:MAG: iron-sulfur cluster repair protein YtfE [Planctomycetota bacterium]|nr:iron-sulfur cluster repair protein YtfE [Planctomycetota bacterium]
MQAETIISGNETLADLAVSYAGASRVFYRYQLDFCCNGQVALAEACQTKGLSVDQLINELDAERAKDSDFKDWRESPNEALIDHILVEFHEDHRREVPRLLEMARKVERVHGEKASCPKGLGDFLETMLASLENHMQKEEQILFPLIKSGKGAMATCPIQVMEHEHVEHGENLGRLRALVTDFKAPPEACRTWQALYLGLQALEQKLMEHIQLENNVLFPNALAS